jgi:hypothetical protein
VSGSTQYEVSDFALARQGNKDGRSDCSCDKPTLNKQTIVANEFPLVIANHSCAPTTKNKFDYF